MRNHARLAIVPLLLALAGLPAAAQTCDRSGCGRASCATPATPAPADRWVTLRPTDTSLPRCTVVGPAFCRDSTVFNEFREPYSGYPWFMSVDAENGYLLVALSHGLQVWDARTNPANPEPVSQLSFTAFPVWSSNLELKWPLQDVDAPAGVDTVAAMAGQGGIGLVAVDLRDKMQPKVAYQNSDREGDQVYATTLGGRHYAFLAADVSSGGLFAYDLTRALDYEGCFESGGDVQCPGVALGRIGSHLSAGYVDGVERFVAATFGSSRGVEIWDVANPASPQLALTGLGDRPTYGVAMWREGSHYYLAVRTDRPLAPFGMTGVLEIYDVSCLAGAGGCASLGAPLKEYPESLDRPAHRYLTFSRSGSVPFLYLGTESRCSTSLEALLDVSNPSDPRAISSSFYWSWYYRSSPTGFNLVGPRAGKFVGDYFYRAALSIFDFHQRTANTGGSVPSIFIEGPREGFVNRGITFAAHASQCTPDPVGWTWDPAGGTITGDPRTANISVSWPGTGSKTLAARNSACGSAVGTWTVSVLNAPGDGVSLEASFTQSPATPRPDQQITFDASLSSGDPTRYSWDFGDGTLGVGKIVFHSYASAGVYAVKLTVSRPGAGSGCTAGTCSDDTTRFVVVTADGPPPPNAAFQTSATCVNQFGFEQCTATVGAPVTFTATGSGTSFAWDFGDGSTASGTAASHTWSQPGSYVVSLTVGNGQTTTSSTKLFEVASSPGPGPSGSTVLLPWIAQTRGALVQSSDLYVHNPSASPVDVILEFFKRGAPEPVPPQAVRSIPPNGTLFVADAVGDLFDRENLAGFLTVEAPSGAATPVVTSVNTTFQGALRFGQTVPGVTLGSAVPASQDLVGLNDDRERLAYFGVTNPNPAPATVRLRFFTRAGQETGHTTELTVPSFGQRQFQVREIRADLGVNGSDYRVRIETLAGGPVYPYGSNLRNATGDPAFVEPAVPETSRAWLVGVLSTTGLQDSLWRTDAVLANLGAQPLRLEVTFLNVGVAPAPTAAVPLTLQPGETRRLADVINSLWGLRGAIGVLTFVSREPSGALPAIQGESYDNARPARRFGQSMMALGEADAAGPGKGQYLAGLRQDGQHRTTLWLFNPSGETGVYDLVYRGLDGAVLGRLDGVALAPGRARQLSPGQHPLPASGVSGGFTVQALVRSGRLLAAGQVVDNATNDPAYVRGETR